MYFNMIKINCRFVLTELTSVICIEYVVVQGKRFLYNGVDTDLCVPCPWQIMVR